MSPADQALIDLARAVTYADEGGHDDLPEMVADLRAALRPDDELLQRLIREAIETAEYGLGRDGCPFCAAVTIHTDECIAAKFGARSYVDGVHPEETNR